MGLDIRTPIGLMFAMLGLLLLVFGIFSDPIIYERSLGVNVNIGWGAVLLLFGLVMVGLAKFAGKNPPPASEGSSGGRPAH